MHILDGFEKAIYSADIKYFLQLFKKCGKQKNNIQLLNNKLFESVRNIVISYSYDVVQGQCKLGYIITCVV